MKKGTILLAGESSLSALAIAGMLRGKIERLDLAGNVKELMQHYQSKHYDLILLKWHFHSIGSRPCNNNAASLNVHSSHLLQNT